MEVAQRTLFAGAGAAKRVSARCDERRGQMRLGSVCPAVSPPGLCLHRLVDVFVSCFQMQRLCGLLGYVYITTHRLVLELRHHLDWEFVARRSVSTVASLKE